ncbi:hypothetical protein IAU60_005716 [Kwoniella sp. DSM 27419]
MTSIFHSFEPARPQGYNGVQSSPSRSPPIQRSSSHTSLHLAPGSYPPHLSHEEPSHPTSTYTAPGFRPYMPAMVTPAMPQLQTSYWPASYPTTAPPAAFYPGVNSASMYDSKASQPMIRTVSHAHPMASATEQTASSRYSSSPPPPIGLMDAPASAAVSGGQSSYPSTGLSLGLHTPSFHVQHTDGEIRSINPSLFNFGPSYPMSRSTSGASETEHETVRLVTPAYEYQPDRLSPAEQELRKVSDSLGENTRKLYSPTFNPKWEFQSHAPSVVPQPQPESAFFAGRPFNHDQFALSTERGDIKPDIIYADTEYERERQAQIASNKKVFDEIGLGDPSVGFRATRSPSVAAGAGRRKHSTPIKQRLRLDGPVRASPRLRELSRTVSYADLDAGPLKLDNEDEEYHYEEEDDYRLAKRSRGSRQVSRAASVANPKKKGPKPQLSLWGLCQVYPDVLMLYPLFYYTLNNDLTINSDSVPLIGSIPSTCTPLEKAEMLQQYFHRARRVLAQLDTFTSRCDRKYEGPLNRWEELEYHTRIAIRDVRRKVVERCENYKYTRRDLLDKHVGKNKWQPIEHSMIMWQPDGNTDPAGDLAHVTLTHPTAPPDVYAQQMRYQNTYAGGDREIKPFPQRARMVPAAPRTVSIAMADPDDYAFPQAPAYPSTGLAGYTCYGAMQGRSLPSPAYGESSTAPVSVPMHSAGSSTMPFSSGTAGLSFWDGTRTSVKRSLSYEDGDSPESEEHTHGTQYHQ